MSKIFNNKFLLLSVIINVLLAGVLVNGLMRLQSVVPSQRGMTSSAISIKLTVQHYRQGSLIGTYTKTGDIFLMNMMWYLTYFMSGSASELMLHTTTGTWEYPYHDSGYTTYFFKGPLARIECGTGTTAASPNDYCLNNAVGSSLVGSWSTSTSPFYAAFAAVISFSSSYTIREFGFEIGSYPSVHYMLARDVIASPGISVTAGDTITVTYEIDYNA